MRILKNIVVIFLILTIKILTFFYKTILYFKSSKSFYINSPRLNSLMSRVLFTYC